MTGLLTRSGVEKLIEWRLGSRSARDRSTVLYGDIDQLHVVNDLLGFEAGDQVIAAVAHALAGAPRYPRRSAQPPVRRPFHDLLSGCPLDRARAIGDELRDAVSAVPLAIGADSIPLSISFGAATVRSGERSFDHALAGRRSRVQGRQGPRPQSRRILRSARLEHQSPHRRHRDRRPAAQRAGERQLPDFRPADRAAAAARASASLRNAAASHR